MDIRTLSAAGIAQPRSNTPAQPDTAAGSFARSLEQASGRSELTDVNRLETRPAASDSKPDQSNSAKTALEAQPVIPNPPVESQESLVQPPLQVIVALDETARTTVVDDMLLASNPATLDDMANGDPADGTGESLDTLEEIRRRLALIEQAGQMPDDATSAGVAAVAMVVPPVNASAPANAAAAATGSSVERALDPLPRFAKATGDSVLQPAQQQAQQPAASAADSIAATFTALSDGESNLPAQAVDTASRSESTSATLFAPSAISPALASDASQTATSVATTLNAPLASREWQQGLGQQLVGLHQRGEQSIELHLHPSELGPLSVSLKIGELGAQAQFLSAHAHVRAAVEQAIPQLREALASQGISLSETSVGEQRQPPREQQSDSSSSRRSTLALELGDDNRNETPATLAPMAGRGQVDLYA